MCDMIIAGSALGGVRECHRERQIVEDRPLTRYSRSGHDSGDWHRLSVAVVASSPIPTYLVREIEFWWDRISVERA